MTRQVPWLRIVAEGTAIVVSILLAFAIQAWWDQRVERRAEQVALRGLSQDFAANLVDLRGTILAHELASDRITRLMTLPADDLAVQSSDSSATFLFAMRNRNRFAPRDGTLEALLASGSLSVLNDPGLRDLLVTWKGDVERLGGETAFLQAAAADILRRLSQLGEPTARSTFLAAIRDDELSALLREKQEIARAYLNGLTPLASEADSILSLISLQLDDVGRVVSVEVQGLPPDGSTLVRSWGALRAIATWSDGSTRDVTFGADWTLSDSSAVAITETGIGRALAPGSTDICVSYRGVEGCASLQVLPRQ